VTEFPEKLAAVLQVRKSAAEESVDRLLAAFGPDSPPPGDYWKNFIVENATADADLRMAQKFPTTHGRVSTVVSGPQADDSAASAEDGGLASDPDLRPWQGEAIRLWNDNHTAEVIGERVSRSVHTVNNFIIDYRKKYPERVKRKK